MGIEIERKFLLKKSAWLALKTKLKGVVIKQGYLNTDPDRNVRVRIFGKQGYLTIKGRTIGASRLEFEYEIPLIDAQELLKLCQRPIIEKQRYTTQLGLEWVIDEFEGDNEGLVVAEVELESEKQTFELPQWLAEEVTTDTRYYNSNLVKYPYKNWFK